MMDEAAIKRQLAEFRNRLNHIDDERKALQDIVKGYETLLRAISGDEYRSDAPATFFGPINVTKRAQVSMRSSVAQALRESKTPLHSRDILARVTAMGATTTAKSPTSVIDLVALDLANRGLAQKVAPRTWQWVGSKEGSG